VDYCGTIAPRKKVGCDGEHRMMDLHNLDYISDLDDGTVDQAWTTHPCSLASLQLIACGGFGCYRSRITNIINGPIPPHIHAGGPTHDIVALDSPATGLEFTLAQRNPFLLFIWLFKNATDCSGILLLDFRVFE
jgi:hypothetical protein